ncbi:MAG: glycoside hydrolase family 19 protein [Acetobacteraceae bacterium]
MIDGLMGQRTSNAWAEFQTDIAQGDPTSVDAGSAATLQQQVANATSNPGCDFTSVSETQASIISQCKMQGLHLRDQIAYVLATVEHETARGRFQPVREGYYLGEKAEAYRRGLKYYPYYGRGYVQVTWDYNYKLYGDLLEQDLFHKPDLAMVPSTALYILVHGFKVGAFTGRPLTNYINQSGTNFVQARRCINGVDQAEHIKDLALRYVQTLPAT